MILYFYNLNRNPRVDSQVINNESWKLLSCFLYTVHLNIKVYESLLFSSEHHREELWHYHEGLAHLFITSGVLSSSDGFSLPTFPHSFCPLSALDSACSQSSLTAFTGGFLLSQVSPQYYNRWKWGIREGFIQNSSLHCTHWSWTLKSGQPLASTANS